MSSRRHFLAGTALLAVRAAAAQRFHLRRPAVVASTRFPVYIGTDTFHGGPGILLATFDTANGRFVTAPALVAATVAPSWLVAGPATAHRVLYAVNEAPNASASITTFAIDPRTSALRPLGKVAAGSAAPCSLAIDATGHAAFVANYTGGTLSSYRIQPDGTLQGPVQQIDLHTAPFGQNGPNHTRQDGPHPHATVLSPDNRFLLVNDLGHDETLVFQLDPETAAFKLVGSPFRNGRAGAGPRHLVFHPNGRWVYSINELDSTIDHYLWTETHGASAVAELINTGTPVSTLAPGTPAGRSTAAEIAISPNGHYLYASNRGEDSLAVFEINDDSGALKLIQTIPCGGKTPRQFTLDPTGRWLLCGNQTSGSVTVFARDPGTGRLSGPVQSVPVSAPEFILFLT